MKGLTPKQERFALEYFKTGNASEAYRLAYDCKTAEPLTINKRASELLARGDIAGRIDDLRAKAEKKAILSKDRAMEILANIAEGADKESDRVAALKVAGKWSGWEAPTRQQIEAAFTSPFERFIEAAKEPEGAPEDGV
jgi:phage terminase small subunit